MNHLVDLNEASRITGKSLSWVRSKAKTLEHEGRASKKSGKWEIERSAILAFQATSQSASQVPQSNLKSVEGGHFETQLVGELRSQISELRQEKKELKEDNRRLNSLNLQLQSEVKGLLSDNNSKSIISRWLRI